MALKKLPIQFANDRLSGSPEDLLGMFDVSWAGYRRVTLEVGQSLLIRHAETLLDFQRTTFVVVLSGQFQAGEGSMVSAPGDAFVLEQWGEVRIKAKKAAELLIGQTHARPSLLAHTSAASEASYRHDTRQDLRLPSPADLAELLHTLQTGLHGQPVVAFSVLCNDVIHDWRLNYHEPTILGRKLDRLSDSVDQLIEQSRPMLFGHELPNGQSAHSVLERWLRHWVDIDALRQNRVGHGVHVNVALFEQPVFIVAAPRSGSTMLFEAMSTNKNFWTIGDESHHVFESIKELHPAAQGFSSNRLTAEQLTETVGSLVVGGFVRRLRDAQGQRYGELPLDQQPPTLRFLEKTPKNALRIPFLKALFPSAKFVFLHRQANANIGSIIDAWQSGRFITYPTLPGWVGLPWSLLLCRGWGNLKDQPLAHVAAWQWASTNQQILDDLSGLPSHDWCAVSYESIVERKGDVLKSVCDFAGVPFGPRLQALVSAPLAESKYTLSTPNAEKWRRHEAAINAALNKIESVNQVSARLSVLSNVGVAD